MLLIILFALVLVLLIHYVQCTQNNMGRSRFTETWLWKEIVIRDHEYCTVILEIALIDKHSITLL